MRYYQNIIGAGCIGSFQALFASQLSETSILLLESQSDCSQGTTKANSGIVHSGHNTKAGTLKAKFVDEGNKMIKEFSKKLNFGFKQCGEIVVARQDQIQQLNEMYQYAQKLNLDAKYLNQDELLQLEPNLNKELVAGLLVRDAGVLDPYEMTVAVINSCKQNGVKVQYNAAVTDIKYINNQYNIYTNENVYKCKMVINCAGLYADVIAKMVDPNTSIKICPRKGEEYLLNKKQSYIVNHIIFPLPTATSKGTLVIPTVDNTVMVGPTADVVQQKDDVTTSATGLKLIFQKAKELIPSLNERTIISSFAGCRAVDVSEDFVINSGTQSPALTCSPSIAKYTFETYIQRAFDKKIRQIQLVPLHKRFAKCSDSEQIQMIKSDVKHSKIICGCELVTAADIENAITDGATTIDGIKIRTRAGMGNCQGGMCLNGVTNILSNRLAINKGSVSKRGCKTELSISQPCQQATFEQYKPVPLTTQKPVIQCKYSQELQDSADILIIGAGPAGLAAAIEAKKQNSEYSVVILEKSDRAGGILNQCIHAGFGLKRYHKELTGPEYAEMLTNEAINAGVMLVYNAYAADVDKQNNVVKAIIYQSDITRIHYKQLILTTGSRERTRSEIQLQGSRPAGLYTAGQAQMLININGILPGKRVIILGSGDIGLIMARRLTLSGAKVLGVYELINRCNGLSRNRKQCLDDFNIPLHLSTTVVEVKGKDRVEAVVIAPVDPQTLKPDYTKQQTIECDCLLLSVGLIPQQTLQQVFTPQIKVNSYKQIIQNVYTAGNSLQIHDLADEAAEEGEVAGKVASQSIVMQDNQEQQVEIEKDNYFGYIIPQRLYVCQQVQHIQKISFRTRNVYGKSIIKLLADGEVVSQMQVQDAQPAIMMQLVVNQQKLYQQYQKNNNLKLQMVLEQIIEEKQQFVETEKQKQVQCIICPNSCIITVDIEDQTVTGNKCNRGKVFSLQEVKKPMRIFSTTIGVEGGNMIRLPVKIGEQVEVDKMIDISLEIQKMNIKVDKEIPMGSIVGHVRNIPIISCCTIKPQ